MLLFIGISENIIWVEVVESSDEIESTKFSISDIFNFAISKEDMKEIEKLNDGFRIGMNPNEVYDHPEIIKD